MTCLPRSVGREGGREGGREEGQGWASVGRREEGREGRDGHSVP